MEVKIRCENEEESFRDYLRKSFTLIEVLVVLAVLSFVILGTSRAFVSVQRAWRKQQDKIVLIENSRWALERITDQLRYARASHGDGDINLQEDGRKLVFGIDVDGNDEFDSNDTKVWYWRGDVNGDSNSLYCGTGQEWRDVDNGQICSPFIAHADKNSKAYNIFDKADGLITLTLVLRPFPNNTDSRDNRSFTIQTKVRARNP